MSTYRERREARAERLRGWADSRARKAAELHARNDPYRGDVAFNTQPGHIPERVRAIRRTEKAWEHSAKAAEMRARADSIETAASRAIYDDDPDAVDRLAAKLAALEAERAGIKTYNVSCRKGNPDPGLLPAQHRDQLDTLARIGALRPDGQLAGYVLSNLGGVISATRKRLERLRAANA